MSRFPAITVLVPVHNVAKYLPTCLESIRSQSYTDFEVVLVDDGSTDGSPELCDDVAREDARFRVVHQANAGVSMARNAGLEHARTDWLTFVDSDDWIASTYLEQLIGLLGRGNQVIPWAGVVKVDEGGESVVGRRDLGVPTIFSRDEALAELSDQRYGESMLSTSWGKLIPRRAFDGVRYPKGRILDDEFVAHRWLSMASQVVRIESAKYYYRQRPGSIVSTLRLHPKRCEDALDAIVDRIRFYRTSGLDRHIGAAAGWGLRRALSFLFSPLTWSNELAPDQREAMLRHLAERATCFAPLCAQEQLSGAGRSFWLFARHPAAYVTWTRWRRTRRWRG